MVNDKSLADKVFSFARNLGGHADNAENLNMFFEGTIEGEYLALKKTQDASFLKKEEYQLRLIRRGAELYFTAILDHTSPTASLGFPLSYDPSGLRVISENEAYSDKTFRDNAEKIFYSYINKIADAKKGEIEKTKLK
jgi:hypothetical protein